jgi:predicted N-acetyltransferase YhbS
MNCKILDKNSQEEVENFFVSVFSSSEGDVEGELVGNLASKLSSRTDNEEVICICAYDEEAIIGVIFFTRLRFKEPIMVYMLAPVAVGTKYQGKGVGQALINYGLDELKDRSLSVAITYGDPSFYSRVGFQALPESVIKAPLKLSMPEGWLGRSLTGDPIPVINDRPTCVEEFNDPVYW